MTTAQISVFEQVDSALNQILQSRAEVTAQPAGVQRCLRLAELVEAEAAWWEELSERSRTRAYWRAALVAREHARQTARHWRHQAEILALAETAAQPVPGSGSV